MLPYQWEVMNSIMYHSLCPESGVLEPHAELVLLSLTKLLWKKLNA